MPRRGFIPKREVLPDPVYGTTVVTKLINQIMLDGKRGTAQRICYSAFDTIKEKTGKDAAEVFTAALGNVSPQLSRSARSAVRRWPCAGWLSSAASAAKRPWPSALPPK